MDAKQSLWQNHTGMFAALGSGNRTSTGGSGLAQRFLAWDHNDK